MPWPSAIHSDWKHWFPTVLIWTEQMRIFCLKVFNLRWTFLLSHQYRPVLSQSNAFCHLKKDKQLKYTLFDCVPALYQRQGQHCGIQKKNPFFFLHIFKDRTWHCCNCHHLLHWPQHAASKPAELPVTLHHFIFTAVLLQGLAALE